MDLAKFFLKGRCNRGSGANWFSHSHVILPSKLGLKSISTLPVHIEMQFLHVFFLRGCIFFGCGVPLLSFNLPHFPQALDRKYIAIYARGRGR